MRFTEIVFHVMKGGLSDREKRRNIKLLLGPTCKGQELTKVEISKFSCGANSDFCVSDLFETPEVEIF